MITDKMPMIKKNTLLWPIRDSKGAFRGTTTQSPYIIVDEHYRKTKKKGKRKVRKHRRRKIIRAYNPVSIATRKIQNKQNEMISLSKDIERLRNKISITEKDKDDVSNKIYKNTKKIVSLGEDIDSLNRAYRPKNPL